MIDVRKLNWCCVIKIKKLIVKRIKNLHIVAKMSSKSADIANAIKSVFTVALILHSLTSPENGCFVMTEKAKDAKILFVNFFVKDPKIYNSVKFDHEILHKLVKYLFDAKAKNQVDNEGKFLEDFFLLPEFNDLAEIILDSFIVPEYVTADGNTIKISATINYLQALRKIIIGTTIFPTQMQRFTDQCAISDLSQVDISMKYAKKKQRLQTEADKLRKLNLQQSSSIKVLTEQILSTRQIYQARIQTAEFDIQTLCEQLASTKKQLEEHQIELDATNKMIEEHENEIPKCNICLCSTLLPEQTFCQFWCCGQAVHNDCFSRFRKSMKRSSSSVLTCPSCRAHINSSLEPVPLKGNHPFLKNPIRVMEISTQTDLDLDSDLDSKLSISKLSDLSDLSTKSSFWNDFLVAGGWGTVRGGTVRGGTARSPLTPPPHARGGTVRGGVVQSIPPNASGGGERSHHIEGSRMDSESVHGNPPYGNR